MNYYIKIENEKLLSLACDFRDIEDSIIWSLQMLNDYQAKRAIVLAEALLKEIIRYKSENIPRTSCEIYPPTIAE